MKNQYSRIKKFNIKKNTKLIVAKVLSESSGPIIKKGELILLETDCRNIRQGDIVGYISARGIPLVHRVIRISRTYIQTAADNNRRVDSPARRKNIVGKVIKIKIRGQWKILGHNLTTQLIDRFIALFMVIVYTFPESGILFRIQRKITAIRRKLIEIG